MPRATSNNSDETLAPPEYDDVVQVTNLSNLPFSETVKKIQIICSCESNSFDLLLLSVRFQIICLILYILILFIYFLLFLPTCP